MAWGLTVLYCVFFRSSGPPLVPPNIPDTAPATVPIEFPASNTLGRKEAYSSVQASHLLPPPSDRAQASVPASLFASTTKMDNGGAYRNIKKNQIAPSPISQLQPDLLRLGCGCAALTISRHLLAASSRKSSENCTDLAMSIERTSSLRRSTTKKGDDVTKKQQRSMARTKTLIQVQPIHFLRAHSRKPLRTEREHGSYTSVAAGQGNDDGVGICGLGWSATRADSQIAGAARWVRVCGADGRGVCLAAGDGAREGDCDAGLAERSGQDQPPSGADEHAVRGLRAHRHHVRCRAARTHPARRRPAGFFGEASARLLVFVSDRS